MDLIKLIILFLKNLFNTGFLINPLFYIICIILLGLTFFIFISNSIINIILSLLIIYILTGILFIILGLEFLGFMTIIIFAGAIIILFIFVLMLIDFKLFKKQEKFDNFFHIFLNFIYFILLLIIFIPKFIIFDYYFSGINNYLIIKQSMMFYYFNTSYLLIQKSQLYSIAYILFTVSWFETLFIGLILIMSLIYIIYFFKK